MPKLQADLGRNTVVVVAAAVIGLAVLGYAGYSFWQSRTTPASHLAEIRGGGRAGTSQETEHYSQVLEQYNEKHAAQAAATPSDTYISVMSTRTKSVPLAPDMPPPSAQAAPAPPVPPPVPTSTPTQPQPQQVYAASYPTGSQGAQQYRAAPVDADRVKNLSEQVTGLLANWTAQPHGLAKVSEDDKGYAQSLMPPEMLQAIRTSASAGQGEQKGTQLIGGLTDAAALLRTNIDTDESSETEAYVPSGPYAGALFSAPGYKLLGNSVDLTFTLMKWNGHTYKVTAKAVDEHTLRTSLSGDVNNRYMSRILLPALAAGIGRAGQLYQQAGTQTVITPLGGAIQTSPSSPSLKDVGGTVIGGAGQAAATVLTQDAANTPARQVLVTGGTTIGIRFLAPVFTGDELTGGALQAQGQAAAVNEPSPVRRQPAITNASFNGAGAPFDNASSQQSSQALAVQTPFVPLQPAAARNP